MPSNTVESYESSKYLTERIEYLVGYHPTSLLSCFLRFFSLSPNSFPSLIPHPNFTHLRRESIDPSALSSVKFMREAMKCQITTNP
mmetsp:Transcript_7847/g.15593  ORF Transcript_7847/g.15593 Transcript_7847/m.15593 type:complete len:86 (+) Transcript_7847:386-643(+)